ncbi:MAG TPA: glycoside hydrolase family 76 protein [Draconibacterium sp.]|nr:glycoside hydrolase family 76 protein [Draconibacterium sp.]
MAKFLVFSLGLTLFLAGCSNKKNNQNIVRAEATLIHIFQLYDSGYDHLLNETYPYKEDNKVTYLAGADTLKGKRVAYLWPTSGVFSGVNTLLKSTKNQKYAEMLKMKIFPGLQHYYDTTRKPFCYQSYITEAGHSDRFYDDNVWLALDFCESFQLTGEAQFLQKSKDTWKFVISGWDENLDGGIYWCEQKKKSKNTCSNAPAAVLAFKLFEATKDSSYFYWGEKIYNWTKANLQDPADHLYFDNVKMNGKVDSAKYTYNSGQMLQATALLYKFTGEKDYLSEAQNIAKSAISHFTEDFTTPEGRQIRLFKNTGNWFNTILFRGYAELYQLDNNPEFIQIFQDNLEQLWNHVRDENGLFGKDWTGKEKKKYQWLLDQASLVEMWATMAEINDSK